eukprot:CAMPEP_0172528790 /NCGR_PEP_ID=MMETSP1067-20121228/3053_1 /TAXON_ID=265564 ORGANISM="Thalassiosira punctigera, Strain Tpunct2005C2" /NCGR_SAMPLE_ID=MMETSP1067 /ASSEMBLY_ACC=CAM_ASM_000444 /LENGTH=178 /DNA_ID=CAMNT_0013312755 /DNA_START=100 /DNA_END=636 /DNA_ORIENTATION=+
MSEEEPTQPTTTEEPVENEEPTETAATSDVTFEHGDGCCACNCTKGGIGAGGCCLTVCCPCVAFCKAAEDSKVDDLGIAYLVLGFLGFNCCSLVALGMHTEEKRGLKKHGMAWHVLQSCFDGCTCHSCRVVNECKVYAAQGAVGGAEAPTSTAMVRADGEGEGEGGDVELSESQGEAA